MIIGVTGHRKIELDLYPFVIEKATSLFKEYNPEKVISGMALGFDGLVCDICIENNIPYIAAVPFLGQENVWNNAQKEKYKDLLDKACEVRYIGAPGYAAYKMFWRNEWIVDNSDLMIAYYDYSGKGGTYQCIKYAELKNKTVINIGDYDDESD